MEIQGLVLGKHWHLEDEKREWNLQEIQGRESREMEGDENQLRREV